jgi:hypothetical protein
MAWVLSVHGLLLDLAPLLLHAVLATGQVITRRTYFVGANCAWRVWTCGSPLRLYAVLAADPNAYMFQPENTLTVHGLC